MSNKHNIENNKHLKKNPFAVPNGYFAELEDKLAGIPKEDKTKVIPLFTPKIRRRLLAVAAVLVVVITATWQFLPENTEEQALTADDIIALTTDGYLPYSEFAFLEVIETDDLDDLSFEDENLSDYYQETQPELFEEYYLTEEL